VVFECATTITTTLKRLRNFFHWLSREAEFRSKLNPNYADSRRSAEEEAGGSAAPIRQIFRLCGGGVASPFQQKKGRLFSRPFFVDC
jgi:hypothetical protein